MSTPSKPRWDGPRADQKGRRRLEQGFLGASNFLTPEGKLQKQAEKRVGIMGVKAPARDGAEVYDESGKTKIDTITSGTFLAMLEEAHRHGIRSDGACQGRYARASQNSKQDATGNHHQNAICGIQILSRFGMRKSMRGNIPCT